MNTHLSTNAPTLAADGDASARQIAEQPTSGSPLFRVSDRRTWLAALGGSLLASLSLPWLPRETSARRWFNHEQANRHWEQTQSRPPAEREPLKWVSPYGPATFGNVIPYAEQDIDRETTARVQLALSRRDHAAAQTALDQAHSDLAARQAATRGLREQSAAAPILPTIGTDIGGRLASTDLSYVHVVFFDPCLIDGDLIEVAVGDRRYATVPLAQTGIGLSLPCGDAPLAIEIIGKFDRRGGITVGIRTSVGTGYLRVLARDQRQTLLVAARR